jgi:hypothetical protein
MWFLDEIGELTTNSVVAHLVKRIADDERQRDTVREREEEIAARKAQLIQLNGQRRFQPLSSQ